MEKTWGGEPFWGLGYEWDPDWFLTERQKASLMEIYRAFRRDAEAARAVADPGPVPPVNSSPAAG